MRVSLPSLYHNKTLEVAGFSINAAEKVSSIEMSGHSRISTCDQKLAE